MPVTINGSTGITDADGGTVLSTADFASQAEAQAGTDNTKPMTALRVNEAISALSPTVAKKPTIASGAAAATQAFTGLGAYGGVDFFMHFYCGVGDGAMSFSYSTNGGSSWSSALSIFTFQPGPVMMYGSFDFATGNFVLIGGTTAATQYRVVTTMAGASLAIDAVRFVGTSGGATNVIGLIKPNGGTTV